MSDYNTVLSIVAQVDMLLREERDPVSTLSLYSEESKYFLEKLDCTVLRTAEKRRAAADQLVQKCVQPQTSQLEMRRRLSRGEILPMPMQDSESLILLSDANHISRMQFAEQILCGGRESFARGDYQSAYTKFAQGVNLLAKCYSLNVEKNSQLRSKLSSLIKNKALAALKTSMAHEACRDCQEYLTRFGTDAKVTFYLARLLLARGKNSEAGALLLELSRANETPEEFAHAAKLLLLKNVRSAQMTENHYAQNFANCFESADKLDTAVTQSTGDNTPEQSCSGREAVALQSLVSAPATESTRNRAQPMKTVDREARSAGIAVDDARRAKPLEARVSGAAEAQTAQRHSEPDAGLVIKILQALLLQALQSKNLYEKIQMEVDFKDNYILSRIHAHAVKDTAEVVRRAFPTLAAPEETPEQLKKRVDRLVTRCKSSTATSKEQHFAIATLQHNIRVAYWGYGVDAGAG